MGLFQCLATLCLCLVLVSKTCTAGSPRIGQIYPGFEASAKEWSSNNGRFLLSNNSTFCFGFLHALNDTLFLLVVNHISSGRAVWTANRGKLVEDSAKFVFDKSGNVSLHWGNDVVWSPDTSGENVVSMELWDSGNLVLLGNNGSILWQSFGNPTDTLLPGQECSEGMRLISRLNKDNMTTYLEFKSGDLVLYAGYQTPQTYWSLASESRKTNNSVVGKVHSAILESNSWNFYDQHKDLLWKFIFSENTDRNATWVLILGSDGAIIFSNLRKGNTSIPEAIKIPQNFCSTPEACGPYHVCYFFNQCQCPASLHSRFNCKPPIASTCNSSRTSTELVFVGTKLEYFALAFVTPLSRYSLDTCKEACLSNCSCAVLFFENHSGDCFLFDSIGGFQRPPESSAGYVSYMKVSRGNGGVNPRTEVGRSRQKHILSIVLITVSTIVVIAGILYVGIWYHRRKRISVESSQENFEEDSFSNNFSVMPVRFSYDDLCRATKCFSTKVGQGGFGSVYLGTSPDGTQLAVKKLEGVGQGMKEFRAEVSIFGNVHHIHLVKLKGFCAEGPHRLLVYEYMEKGSLDKWIFKINKEKQLPSWETRFNIALGTAKGLAYLHDECEVKIVHCDIKPQNVLLDENFTAKVSDFGLAKLMNREESLVHTTLRGTRGYLAPEWITNNPISEKSDVYSYGMVLLEIIGGRKNYDPGVDSEKAYFPSYAFKMLEEKLGEIIDPRLDVSENDERLVTAIKVALWCIQDEMHLRPPMTKVVHMLEGLCAVPQPPTPSQLNNRVHPASIKWNSDDGTSSEPVNDNSGTPFSDAQISGPR